MWTTKIECAHCPVNSKLKICDTLFLLKNIYVLLLKSNDKFLALLKSNMIFYEALKEKKLRCIFTL